MPDQPGRIVVAYVLLAIAVFANNGAFFPALLPPLLASFALVIAAVAAARQGRSVPGAPLSPKLLAGAVILLALLALARPPGESPRPLALVIPTLLATVGLAALLARAIVGPGPVGARRIHLWLAGYAALGLLTIVACPQPHIDVFTLQTGGAADLLAGRDPYAASFPNPYDATDTATYFGAPIAALTHYPYPPLTLLLTTAAALLGDVRLAALAAQVLGGLLLLRLCRRASLPHPLDIAVLGLYLLHPRGLFVLERSWTEPFLAAAVLAALAVPPTAPAWISGLALAAVLSAKQYGVLLAAPLLGALEPARRPVALSLGFGVAAVLCLPFLFWHPRDFLADVIRFQLDQPFRPDALSLPAAVAWLGGPRAPGALAPLGAIATLIWLGGLRQVALVSACTLFVFFLLAKQAFCNYYYLVGVLLLAAIAECRPHEAQAR